MKTKKKHFPVIWQNKQYYDIKNFDCHEISLITTEEGGSYFTTIPISPLEHRRKRATAAKVEIVNAGIYMEFIIWDDWGDRHIMMIPFTMIDKIERATKSAIDLGLISKKQTIQDTDILTPEILITLGFKEAGKDKYSERTIYRISPKEFYGDDIDIVLSDYPESNPNSGIISIHNPEADVWIMPSDLAGKDKLTDKETERAVSNTVKLEERSTPIAWHVTRVKRLRGLYYGLTGTDL